MDSKDTKKVKASGAALIAEIIRVHGVKFICNLCGESTSPFILEANKAGIKVIDTRNEATGVFAAKASARLTGIPGVMVVTMGPGLANTILGALDAKFDQVPLLILSGGVPTKYRGIGYLQDLNQLSLMKEPCKAAFSIQSKGQIVSVMKKAFHTALSGVPGPVYVELPLDILLTSYKFTAHSYLRQAENFQDPVCAPIPSNETSKHIDLSLEVKFPGLMNFSGQESVPDVESSDYEKKDHDLTPLPVTYPKALPSAIKKSAKLIDSAEKPVLIVGSQATLRTTKIKKLSKILKTLGIPTFTVFAAKGLLGKTNKYLLSQDRLLKDVLAKADCVILAGVECDYITVGFGLQLPEDGTIISVNRSKRLASLNDGVYWKSTQIVESDVGYYLIKLAKALTALNYSPREAWISKLRDKENEFELSLQSKAKEKADAHLNPLSILAKLEKTTAHKDIVWVFDVGDFVASAIAFIKPRKPLRWVNAVPFAGVGPGIGYALGAKLAFPNKEVWSIVGDGSCGYSIMEFDTLLRHQINIITIAGNDGQWSAVGRKQEEEYGTKFSCTLLYTNYEQVVKPLGGQGFLVDEKNEDQLEDVLRNASDLVKNSSVFINVFMGTTDFRAGHL